MFDRMRDPMGADTLVLAATERLAQGLTAERDTAMLAGGRRWWPAASIYTLSSWLAGEWDKSLSGPAPAGEAVTGALLAEIIETDAAGRGMELLDVEATARAAEAAISLAALYEMDLSACGNYSEETAAFSRWVARYREELSKRYWIDRSGLYRAVADLVESGRIQTPSRVIHAGFDETPPALARLLDAFRSRGAEVGPMPFPALPGEKMRTAISDPVEEVSAAALWAAGFLQRNPGSRVGVAALEMESYGPLAERIFAEKLAPLAALGPGGGIESVFDISLGGPLADEPAAATAILFFELAAGPADTERWLALFSSPFWEAGAEWNRAALLARKLSGLGRTRLDFTTVLRAFAGEGEGGVPGARDAAERLRVFREILGTDREQAPSRWAAGMTEALNAAGWLGGVTLRSREYQAAVKFREALGGLSVLDGVRTVCGFGWILKRLKNAAHAPFRPKTAPARVTVMGMLEAAGMSFDGLWVLGASEGALPPPVTVNPFIPYPLQVRHGLRQAVPSELLKRSEGIVKRLLGAGREVVVSHPRFDFDRTVERGPSPLTRELKEGIPQYAEDFSLEAQVRKKGKTSVVREKEHGKPLAEGEEVSGGAYLFACQAQCPFKAFATVRLGIRSPDRPADGLDPRDRGSMLHDALMNLHARFRTGAEIRAASPSELENAVDEAVRSASLKVREGGRDAGRAALMLEEARTGDILKSWLEREKERGDFEVLERECAREILVGKLPVRLKLDRIDRSESGDLIIDYKTGQTNEKVAELKSERLVRPQLPLYALAWPEATGVAYAHLRKGETKIVGLSAAPPIEGMAREEDWEGLKNAWRERLGALAGEFAEGRADPDPGGKREFCKNCGLDPLCRPGAGAGGEDTE